MQLSNISVVAGDDVSIAVSILPAGTISLAGASIAWEVYETDNGVPIESPILIVKSTASGSITIPDPTGDIFDISLAAADTAALLGNFYQQAKVTDALGNVTTTVQGIMTVTESL
jgi:hypothetical protein